MGIIYLIQQAIYLNTRKFKIGVSRSNSLTRLQSYGANTRIICIIECYNPFDLEREIKHAFKEKFKLFRGHEWFEGDEIDIFKLFIEHVRIYKINYDLFIKLKKENEVIEEKKINKDIDKYDNDVAEENTTDKIIGLKIDVINLFNILKSWISDRYTRASLEKMKKNITDDDYIHYKKVLTYIMKNFKQYNHSNIYKLIKKEVRMDKYNYG